MPEPEETLCRGVSSLTTSLGNINNYRDVAANKKDVMKNTYLLQHIKYDFYKQGSGLLSVVIYVKEICKDSFEINFEAKTLRVKFQTRSKEFLKLHNQVLEDTIFEWRINLRHNVDSENCKYVISPTKLTLTLKMQCLRDQWNSLEELHSKGVRRDTLMNGGGHLNNTHDNTKELATGTKEDQVAERDTNNVENKTENGDENLRHCNGNNVSSENETLTTENSLKKCKKTGCDCKGIPCSHADGLGTLSDENSESSIEIVNVNNTTCGFKEKISNGLDEKGKDVLCNGTESTEHIVTEKCTFQQHSAGSNLSSKPVNTSENNCQSDDGSTDAISTKDLKLDGVKGSIDSSKKEETVRTENDFKLSYNAKIHNCRPGSTGLANQGNLCYINSVVQCLSSVRELRTYLLAKKHCTHINRGNKNGYQGELITSFDCLMRELWSGKERYASVAKLKHTLAKKQRQFMHYGQGDAQEFLTFLISGLHEDLKHEKTKSLNIIKNGHPNEDIQEGSREHWENFLNGNQSIISDLFQGQSFSEIQCKECTKPSTGFDHWMQLNLPIPDDPIYFEVFVFFLDPAKKPLQVKLQVCQRTRCGDFLVQVSKLVHVPAHRLILLRSQYSKISHIFDLIEEITLSSKNDVLIACEIVVETPNLSPSIPNPESNGTSKSNVAKDVDAQDNCRILHISVIQRATHRVVRKCSQCGVEKRLSHCSKCQKVAYCNRECQRKDWKRHCAYCEFQPLIIGTPFIISIESSKATLNVLKKKIFQYASYSVAQKSLEQASGKFHLTLLENLTDSYSKGIKLTEKGDDPIVEENVCLALDWETMLSCDLDCDMHESVKELRSSAEKSCSLDECLKLYWNPENFYKECGWRCDHCKDVRAATRKVMICKHPENLIIHFKRFSYSGNGCKISKHIHFPLKGLDMSPFTHPEFRTTNGAIYDLRAVCSHHGFMNFGHYIAFCKPYSEEELEIMGLSNTDDWLRFNDEKVNVVEETTTENTQAYLLFYHRRKAESFKEESSFANSPQSWDTSETDLCDSEMKAFHEGLETSEVPAEEVTAVNIIDSEHTSKKLVEQPAGISQVSVDEILLEEQLD